jgi:hypothetical protein
VDDEGIGGTVSHLGFSWALLIAASVVGCKSSSPPSGGTPSAGSEQPPGAMPSAGVPAPGEPAAGTPAPGTPGPGAPSPGAAADTAACTGSGPSLIKNGSFETPATRPGTYDLFTTGKDMGGWTVVGADGNVAPISTTFVANGYSVPAQDGAQSVDMTGVSDTPTGVAQTIATTPGTTYCLSFWIGNVSNPGGPFGTSSAILVRIDGKDVTTTTNDGGAETRTASWRRFGVPFTAASAATKLELINADPKGDTSNLLDNVTVN